MYQRCSSRKRVRNLSRFNAFQVSGACVSLLARWRLIFITFLNLENLNARLTRSRANSGARFACVEQMPGQRRHRKISLAHTGCNTSQTRRWIRICVFCALTNAAIEKEGGGGYRVSKRGVLFVRSLYGENMNFNTNRVFVPFLPYRGHSRAKQSVNYPATELICEGWSRAWMQGRVGRDYLELKSARESLCTYYPYTAARASAIGQRDRN